MIKVDYDVPIRRAATEVYEYVTDVERIPEWQHVAGVRKVTRHDQGPLQVGSRFTMERTSRGNTARIEATVTALEPGRRFDFHTIDDDGFVGDFSTTLSGADGSTNLHWSVQMQPAGMMYRVLQPMIAREIRKSASADFAQLRSKLEGGAAGGSF
jgi:uncharacterized membrane protein